MVSSQPQAKAGSVPKPDSPPLKTLVEALLFASEEALSLARLNQVLPEYAPFEIQSALNELARDYSASARAFGVRQVAGGFQICTRQELAPYVARLNRRASSRLSAAALETLAVVAYRQPVLKAEIDKVRGVETGGTLRLLIDRNLIRIMGRRNLPGRPLVYGTTRKFLETFDLPDLDALPTLKELESLGLLNEPRLFENNGLQPGPQAPFPAGVA